MECALFMCKIIKTVPYVRHFKEVQPLIWDVFMQVWWISFTIHTIFLKFFLPCFSKILTQVNKIMDKNVTVEETIKINFFVDFHVLLRIHDMFHRIMTS